MVDLDKLDKKRKGGSSDSKSGSSDSGNTSQSSSSGSSSSSSSSGGSTEPFSMDEDEMMDPDGKEMTKTSRDWADEGADFGFDVEAGEGFDAYVNRQINEVEELHENVEDMASKHMGNFDEFTLYFHALFFNFARNRVGIAETLSDEFDLSDRKAIKVTNKICHEAGEDEMMESLLNDMVENLMEV